MLFIYGGNDPWSAAGISLTGKTDALKMTLAGGNHFTFINSFPDEEREKILKTLERWLVMKILR
jgi:alpha-galactosidase/6-phospho-beta-glucosidase family protein